MPDDISLLGFLCGSGEEYNPDFEDIDTPEIERDEDGESNQVVNNNDDTRLPPIPVPPPIPAYTMVRVQPPGPESDVGNLFRVRAGITNLPPRNSSPVEYSYLFLTNAVFYMITRQTNYYANLGLGKKQNSGEK